MSYPRNLRDRSKYQPHQSTRERMRRIGRLLAEDDTVVPEDLRVAYVDYATQKAAGRRPDVSLGQIMPPLGLLTPGDEYDGLMDVQVVPQDGQD